MTSATRGLQGMAPTALASSSYAVQHDFLIFLITSLIPLGLVLATEVLKDRNKLSTAASRKFLHIATGPLFVLTWPCYSSSPIARYLAALLPGLMSLRFLLAGLGITREPRLVAGTARSGRRQELLLGPLLYGVSHVVLTATCWRNHPAGLMGVAALCVGDGLADVAGRTWGRSPLSHNKTKTWVGSAAFVAGSSIAAAALLLFMRWHGFMLQQQSLGDILAASILASLAAAIAESLPLSDADNVLVPATAAGVGLWWFGLSP